MENQTIEITKEVCEKFFGHRFYLSTIRENWIEIVKFNITDGHMIFSVYGTTHNDAYFKYDIVQKYGTFRPDDTFIADYLSGAEKLVEISEERFNMLEKFIKEKKREFLARKHSFLAILKELKKV